VRGFEVECRRSRQKNHRPRYKVGDLVRLRNGAVTQVMRVVVKDWGVQYDVATGAAIMQHHISERIVNVEENQR
jgi:hypothetical protein